MHLSNSFTACVAAIYFYAVYLGFLPSALSQGGDSEVLPWVEVISPSGGLVVRGDGLRLLLIGHHVNKREDWLSTVNLNAPQDGASIFPYSEEVLLNFDANVIGSLFYDIRVIIGGPKANSDHNLGSPTRIFYELVWNDDFMGHAQGSINSTGIRSYEGNDDYRRVSEDVTGFSRVLLPQSITDIASQLNKTNTAAEEPTSTLPHTSIVTETPTLHIVPQVDSTSPLITPPIRVVQIMGGGFDGQKQIMIEQWRSIDRSEVHFSALWPCSADLQQSESVSVLG